MLIQPAAPFGISIGTVYGEMRCQPFSLSSVVRGQRRADTADPAGDDHAEPLGVHGGRARVGPGLARGHQRQLLAAVHPAGLHAVDHLGRVDGRLRGDPHRQATPPTARLRERTPLRPASIADQVDATSPPSGVVAPSPVTTTVSAPFGHAEPPAFSADVVHHVLHRGEVLQLVVRDLHAELVLSGDGDLDHGQRVDVQVVDEALARRHLVRRARRRSPRRSRQARRESPARSCL